jgi:FkbM family methyltransferase
MTIFQHLKEIFRGVDHPVLLEIGACYCEDTYDIILNANLRAAKFKYYAFEPEPYNIDKIKQENVYNYITLVEKAVGAENGRMTFYRSSGNINPHGPSWTGSGSVKKPKNHLTAHPWCHFDHTTEVDVITLDKFFTDEKLDHIDFAWVDVQGSEGDVVRGGLNALKNTHFLYSEYNDHEQYEGQMKLSEWMALLPGKWTIVEQWPHDVLLKNEDYEHSNV